MSVADAIVFAGAEAETREGRLYLCGAPVA